MPLASYTNIKLGWKDLPERNTPAYYENIKIYDGEKFSGIGILAI
jgi:hypothetical protein